MTETIGSAASQTPSGGLRYRRNIRAEDLKAVRELVQATGFFNSAETEIAVELVQERLAKGAASGYEFVLAESGGSLAGYACYGSIAGTQESHDLYWIVVHPDLQGKGLGSAMLKETEGCIASAGGRRIYVETSSRAQYAPTRAFYARCGYREEARLADFYAPGDGKVIFVKVLGL